MIFNKTSILSIFLLSLISFFAVAKSDIRTFDAENLSSIYLESDKGNINVVGSGVDKIYISVDKKSFSPHKCLLSIEREGQVLRIASGKLPEVKFFSCDVNLNIVIPKNFDLTLETGMGAIDVDGVNGEILFRTGMGNVKANMQSKSINGVVGSGKVSLLGSISNANISLGKGDIELFNSPYPMNKKINLSSGMGNIKVYLPKDSEIFADLSSGSGKITNQFTNSNSPNTQVKLSSGMGNVQLLKN